jgi:hypothetical protein
MISICVNIFTFSFQSLISTSIELPHIGSLISYYKYKSRIWKLERNLTEDMEIDHKYKIFYTQDELNAVYLGPEFRLNYRYTQLLVNFYICWMYAISMPILPLIGSLSFFCSYWIGKIFIKRIIHESDTNESVYYHLELILTFCIHR